MMITGTTKLAGVMGWPVEHSLSPRLHNMWLEKYGIDGVYLPLPVKPENVEEAVLGLAAMGFRGCNVTMPHKEAVVDYMDVLSPAAELERAVNTIIVHDDGTLEGQSTDGFGFIQNLKSAFPDFKSSDGPVAVFGAGGAARAVAAALIEDGATELRIINRTPRTAQLARNLLARDDVFIKAWEWDWREDALEDVTLAVNCTSLGMEGNAAMEIEMTHLPQTAIVTDIVYRPLLTPFLEKAHAHGCRTLDGLGMLIHQARPGFEAWFGRDPEVTDDLHDFLLGKDKQEERAAS